VASTCLATGLATLVCTSAMDGIIASRAGALTRHRQGKRTNWNSLMTSSVECITDLQRWESNLYRISSRPIWDVLLGRPFDSTIKSDASDTSVDAVTYIDGAQGPQSAETVTLPLQCSTVTTNVRPSEAPKT
jgi:hypothetical protein